MKTIKTLAIATTLGLFAMTAHAEDAKTESKAQGVHHDWSKMPKDIKDSEREAFKAKWEAMSPEDKKAFHEKRHEARMERREKMKEKWENASPEEREKMKEARKERKEERREKWKEKWENASPEERAKMKEHKEHRQEMRKERRERMKEVHGDHKEPAKKN